MPDDVRLKRRLSGGLGTRRHRGTRVSAGLTTIASIYGINFKHHMPALEWRYRYAWALGLMVASAAGMITYFERRGWW